MVSCIDYYNLFVNQAYNENNSSALINTSVQQCAKACDGVIGCYGFNYNDLRSICTILYTNTFSPEELVITSRESFYMKSLGTCVTYDIYYYPFYGLSFVLGFILVLCCLCSVSTRKKRRHYSYVMNDNRTIPPAYGTINDV